MSVVALSVGLSCPARAEPDPKDSSAADKLREEAAELVRTGQIAKACTSLEAASALDPSVDNLLDLGECHARIGRTASAWTAFGEAHRIAEQQRDERAADAEERRKAIEPRLATLVVRVTSKQAGLAIQRDDRPLEPAMIGAAIPVDPGAHKVRVTATGREPWSTIVDVPARPGPTVLIVPPLQVAQSTPPPPGMNGVQIAGLTGMSVGLVGLAAGLAFYGVAKDAYAKARELCPGGSVLTCPPEGQAALRSAGELATAIDWMIGAGATTTVVGGLVFLVTPVFTVVRPPARAVASGSSLRVAPALGAMNGVLVSGTY